MGRVEYIILKVLEKLNIKPNDEVLYKTNSSPNKFLDKL